MQIGKLNRLVSIQQRASTQDTFGQQSTGWTNLYTNVHVAIRPLSGREMLAAQAVNSEVSHNINLRYLAGITANMRILYGTRIFNITAVMNIDERNKELMLQAAEGLNDG